MIGKTVSHYKILEHLDGARPPDSMEGHFS